MIQIETPDNFERRKEQHIHLALDPQNQAIGQSKFEQIQLVHEALPDLDFNDINIGTTTLGHSFKTPFFISSMTAGHPNGVHINHLFAKVSVARGWLMGVGSQRRQLFDSEAAQEWQAIRAEFPTVKLLGNIGISQLIQAPLAQIEAMVDSLQAIGMIIHTNPLQECLQPEGTPQFKGALRAIENLSQHLSVPVIIKETGCGFSMKTLSRLNDCGVTAVDISGLGGTHWGRIEGARAESDTIRSNAAQTFKNWGIHTVDALLNAIDCRPRFEIWASGGVRSGLDAAKLLAVGAKMIGIAQPLLEAAMQGEQSLLTRMERFEFELKTAMFCTGCADLQIMRENNVWIQNK